MRRFVIANAAQIVTAETSGPLPRKGRVMRQIGLLPKGYGLCIEGEKIAAIGRTRDLIKRFKAKDSQILDASNQVVLPGFVDSHTHAAFAAARLQDFEMRAQGATYQEIAKRGGGILRSVRDLRRISLEELTRRLLRWCQCALNLGTTTLEVKSGYGLNTKEEEKILRAVQKARPQTPLELVATFLGAHSIGPEYGARRSAYLHELTHAMLPRFRSLAAFCDVFCDKGYFTLEESEQILSHAHRLGYRIKLHAEQLAHSGGAKLALRFRATSVDHLDWVHKGDIRQLARTNTVCTFVPASNFFLATRRYPPARQIIDGGNAVALATDFNPGTAPTLSMATVMAIAVTQMKMTVEEALTAATINGACALGLGDSHGSLGVGKFADILIVDASDYREIPYYFGINQVAVVIKRGKQCQKFTTKRPGNELA